MATLAVQHRKKVDILEEEIKENEKKITDVFQKERVSGEGRRGRKENRVSRVV